MAFANDQLGLNNPFATPIGQLIEITTDAEQETINWSLLLEICDAINKTEEGPKDAMRAIKKRLQQAAGKSTRTTMFTLTVVETCVKNCGHRFHILVATKDFMQDLVMLIGPKNDPQQVLQEQVLSLIQTRAFAFSTFPDLREVVRTYEELEKYGVQFPPMTDLDNLALIHTPVRHVHTHYPPPVTDVRPPGSLSSEQIAKLRRNLDIVYQTCCVFNDMLRALKPGHESADELVLLQELNATCHQMQAEIVELAQQVQNEDIRGELLRVNDDLLNAFVRYDRFERQCKSQGGGATPDDDEQFAGPPPSYENSATLPLHSRPVPPPATAAVGNLIDFSAATNNVNSVGVANLSLADPRPTGPSQRGSGVDDDFGMFPHVEKLESVLPRPSVAPKLVVANNQEQRRHGNVKDAVVPSDGMRDNERPRVHFDLLPKASSQLSKKALRTVIIDGSNVAYTHGNHQTFSCRGIQLCVQHFLERGHKDIVVILPQKRQFQRSMEDQKIVDDLYAERYIKFTESGCYDDSVMFQFAEQEEGVIVSNDKFRDASIKYPEWQFIITNRRLPYIFYGDNFFLYKDPCGRHGPGVDEVLTKDDPDTATHGAAAGSAGLRSHSQRQSLRHHSLGPRSRSQGRSRSRTRQSQGPRSHSQERSPSPTGGSNAQRGREQYQRGYYSPAAAAKPTFEPTNRVEFNKMQQPALARAGTDRSRFPNPNSFAPRAGAAAASSNKRSGGIAAAEQTAVRSGNPPFGMKEDMNRPLSAGNEMARNSKIAGSGSRLHYETEALRQQLAEIFGDSPNIPLILRMHPNERDPNKLYDLLQESADM